MNAPPMPELAATFVTLESTMRKWTSTTRARSCTIRKVSSAFFVSQPPGHPLTDPHITDDHHIATLTVAQTLDFALAAKAPGPNGRLPGVRRQAFINEVRDLLLRMLNISHTKQTLVGDAFVRGVSGGERKRVSIAEMMTTRARVQSWDNSTRGLDASTALDLAKSLRVMTDVLGQTTFVSLYQAGEGIYDLFDKILIIDKGRQVYFGPGNEARAYFEGLGYKSLPRQSTADYLTGCTDPNERQYAPGRSANDVPSTPEALEHAFRASPYYGDLTDSLEKYKIRQAEERADQEAFRAAVLDDKKRGVSKRSPYTLGFFGQVKALTIRQFQTRMQDRFQLYTSFGLAITLALVIGAAYFDLPLTAAGGFTRGGVVFIAVLVAVFDAFGEIPLMMMGRAILNKQVCFLDNDDRASRRSDHYPLLDELQHVQPCRLPNRQLPL